jgi:hypothetical protein
MNNNCNTVTVIGVALLHVCSVAGAVSVYVTCEQPHIAVP